MGKANDDGQGRGFIEAARELGCEENFDRFDDALRRIGTARPKPHSAEKAEGKDCREEAIERDRTDGRKATEGSRGKRHRGGGLNEESSD